ncbi:hypothetical protein [Coleofasciculus sp. G2-EDA-02]|uniref:hypothetical protein n=1 Tax=Coleofasciculus sp. G2-EDA-02 TaxID=3069529 RepID=UPI0032F94790
MRQHPTAIALISLLCLLSTALFAAKTNPSPTSTKDLSFDLKAVDNRFDPRKLEPGNKFMGLEVVSVQADSLPNYGVIGRVKFRGQIAVTGTYEPNHQLPGNTEIPCFVVDEAAAIQLPRFQGDDRQVWFCFNNPEAAKQQLGGEDTQPKKAIIVIDDYETVYYPSDVFDTATLVGVITQEDRED